MSPFPYEEAASLLSEKPNACEGCTKATRSHSASGTSYVRVLGVLVDHGKEGVVSTL